MKKNYNNKSKGQVIMITVVAFLIISLAVIAGVAVPTNNQVKSVLDLRHSKQGYLSADAANEEVLYRLNKRWLSFTYTGDVTLPFSGGISSIATISGAYSPKTITTTGTDGQTTRYGKSLITAGEGYSFNYGLQVGDGGLVMSNTSTINGDVYANGDIIGSNSAKITGSAIAAAVSSTSPEVSNGNGFSPTSGIDLGRNTTNYTELAQSFVMSTSSPVLRISVNLKKIVGSGGGPANLTMRIMSNSGTSPSNTQNGPDITVPATSISTQDFGWIDVYPSSQISLTKGNTYWIKLVFSGSTGTNYYSVATTTGQYSGGVIKTKASGGSWTSFSPSDQDVYFKIYTGDSSTISGMDIVGNAYAFKINNTKVSGTNMYCQTGSGNTDSSGSSRSCDTGQGVPPTLGFGINETILNDWLVGASTGWTLNSSLNLSGSTATTTSGPLKITGSLNLSNNAVMTLGGPLYVNGNISLSNQAVIKLSSTLGSADSYIVTDGSVTTSNTSQFKGALDANGDPISNSYIIVATKNGNFNINNQGGSVVIITLNGTATFSNGASAKSVTAYKMIMNNSSNLNYESGLANVNFTAGPSGAWNVDSWAEVASP